MVYKEGDRVRINVRGDIRNATVIKDGVDSQNRVRIRPDGIPLDMSIKDAEVIGKL